MGAALSRALDAPAPVIALADPPHDLRERTLALCQEVREAEARHFLAWCVVIDNAQSRRPRELPTEITELEQARLAELHASVVALREHCAEDPALAEPECHALMRAQVEGELTLEAQLRVVRAGEIRQELRATHNESRAAIFETRDALCCGRGWPHHGERVQVRAWIYDSTQPDGRFVHDGEAIYTGGYDTHNVSHRVHVQGLALNRGVLHLAWEPHKHWGNAAPNGDIAMRVAEAPHQPLPCPLPRWPTEADVHGIDELARHAAGEQIALL